MMKQKWICYGVGFLLLSPLTGCTFLDMVFNSRYYSSTGTTSYFSSNRKEKDPNSIRDQINITNTTKNKRIVVYFMDLPGKRPSDHLEDWKEPYRFYSINGGSGEPESNFINYKNSLTDLNRDWHLRWYIWKDKYADTSIDKKDDSNTAVTMCEITTKIYLSKWFFHEEKREGRDWYSNTELGLRVIFYDDGQTVVLPLVTDSLLKDEEYSKKLRENAQKGNCITATPN